MCAVQLVAADRSKNMRYMFRHAEAADIMIVLFPQQYAGYVEQAWCLQQKIVLGLMHVTEQVAPLSLLLLTTRVLVCSSCLGTLAGAPSMAAVAVSASCSTANT